MPRKGQFKERIEVKCCVCEKVECVVPSRAARYKTCSLACTGKLNAERTSQKVDLNCLVCGTPFKVKPSHVKNSRCCSKKCDAIRKQTMYAGEGNPNYGNRQEKAIPWKGGRRISNYGYILLHKPDHPMARPDGYILEHRFIMSEHLGRLLSEDEVIHHKDNNKRNNSIDNLEIMTRSEHTKHHALERHMWIRDEANRFLKVVPKK